MLDRKPSFLWSDHARLKSRLISHVSCSVINWPSFSLIQIYRFYKMYVLLSLFIEVISLTSSVTPTAWLLFRMSDTSLFIPVVFLVVDVFPVPCFEFSTSDRHTRRFQKIRYHDVWHEIVSWECRFKHVIRTCRFCHCTATNGYHRYVGLKMYGLLEPGRLWSMKCVLIFVWCVLHQWKSTASWWRCMEYV